MLNEGTAQLYAPITEYSREEGINLGLQYVVHFLKCSQLPFAENTLPRSQVLYVLHPILQQTFPVSIIPSADEHTEADKG